MLELLALEGRDAGQQFTVDGDEVAIGRGKPRSGQTGSVRLTDPTVSAQQAVLRRTRNGIVLEHRREATNPTLVNGNEVQRHPIQPGDRIQCGLVVLEVRARRGLAASDLTEALTERRATALYQYAEEDTETRLPKPAELTEVRRPGTPRAHLTVVRGLPGAEGQRFPINDAKMSIGRSPDCDIVIQDKGVSRNHAELFWEGDKLVLKHLSATNATFVNGLPVETRETLQGGEDIQLADQVVLKLEIEAPVQAAADQTMVRPRQAQPGADQTVVRPRDEGPKARPTSGRGDDGQAASLMERMEDKIRRDQELESEFGVSGSFLDVDVVDSHGLKAQASRAEYIIVSFERFREFARGIVEEFDGQLLNCNGDELMCFFENPLQAVKASSAIMSRLDAFNEKENLLGRPFRLRQGIHTGECLVDRRRGVAYSTVLDVAGHLQKHAEHNGLLVSEHTHTALPEGLPFELVGKLPKEGIPTYRLTGAVD